jgi:hypothetical protein
MNITKNEAAYLLAIVESDFSYFNSRPFAEQPESEDANIANVAVWTFCPASEFGTGAGGIASSLNKKGLAISYEENGDDSTIQITTRGLAVLRADIAKKNAPLTTNATYDTVSIDSTDEKGKSKMNKIATKSQLVAFVEDKNNRGHHNFAAISALLDSVKDLHGRSGAAREAVKDAGKLQTATGPKPTKKDKKTAKTSDGTPKKRAPKADMPDPERKCLCGCGMSPAGRRTRFVQGHDARLKGMVQRTVAKGEKNVFSAETVAFVTTWANINADIRASFALAVK